jgi:hypothetical protein
VKEHPITKGRNRCEALNLNLSTTTKQNMTNNKKVRKDTDIIANLKQVEMQE